MDDVRLPVRSDETDNERHGEWMLPENELILILGGVLNGWCYQRDQLRLMLG